MKFLTYAKKHLGQLWEAARTKFDQVWLAGLSGFSGVAMALAFLPPHGLLHPNPFDVDLTGVMSGAEDMFNGLFPAFTPIIGIELGVGLVLLVLGVIGVVVLALARKK